MEMTSALVTIPQTFLRKQRTGSKRGCEALAEHYARLSVQSVKETYDRTLGPRFLKESP